MAQPEALTTRIYNYVLGGFGEKKEKRKIGNFRGWVLWVQIPGADLHNAHQAMLWQRSTYKIKGDWHRC